MAEDDINTINPFIDEPIEVKLAQVESLLKSHIHDGRETRTVDLTPLQNAILNLTIGYEVIVGPQSDLSTKYHSIKEAVDAGFTSIYIRNGTYVIDTEIDFTENGVTLVGESKDGVILDCDNITGSAFNITGDNPNIKNLTFLVGSGITADVITMAGSRLTLDNITAIFDGTYDIQADSFPEFVNADSSLIGHSMSNIFLDYSQATLSTTISTNDAIVAFNDVTLSTVSNLFINASGVTFSGALTNLTILIFNDFASSCLSNSVWYSGSDQVGFSLSGGLPSSQGQCSNAVAVGLFFELDAAFSGCSFSSNGVDPSGFGSHGYTFEFGNNKPTINNCTFITANGFDSFYMNGPHAVVTGNRFYGGKKGSIDGNPSFGGACVFSGNVWTSGYTSAAIDLAVLASADNANVIGNVIECTGSGSTPTITVAGGASGTNVQFNQLIA